MLLPFFQVIYSDYLSGNSDWIEKAGWPPAREQGREQDEPQGIEGKLVLRYSAIRTMTVVKFSLEEEEES